MKRNIFLQVPFAWRLQASVSRTSMWNTPVSINSIQNRFCTRAWYNIHTEQEPTTSKVLNYRNVDVMSPLFAECATVNNVIWHSYVYTHT